MNYQPTKKDIITAFLGAFAWICFCCILALIIKSQWLPLIMIPIALTFGVLITIWENKERPKSNAQVCFTGFPNESPDEDLMNSPGFQFVLCNSSYEDEEGD